jgi:hypothetical protein
MAQLDRVQNIGWSSLAEFKILTKFQLLEQEGVQLVAVVTCLPTSVTIGHDRVQNID